MYIKQPDDVKNSHNKIILDCRYDYMVPEKGRQFFNAGHIQGAHYIDLDQDLVGKITEHGGRHPLCDLDEFRKHLESIGVSNDIDVFIYDDGTLPIAARLWYTLQLLGKDAYIVEGGYDALVAAGFTVTTEVPKCKSATLTTPLNLNLIASLDDVIHASDSSSTVVVDSRANERYLGLDEPIDAISGHIPGAVNIFWQDAFNATKLKNDAELKQHFSMVDDFETVIFQCGSGITAAVNLLAYAELGKSAKVYVGSFSDYITHKGLPLIIKDNKKIIL